jgi:hypothetical protein
MKKTPKAESPLSIDAAARALGCDRRTLTAALRRSGEIDFILPADKRGVRGAPRWKLSDACEALELWKVRQAPPIEAPWTEKGAADHEHALAMPCPRCGGRHVELPILPLRGKPDSPEILAWYRQHDFTMHSH